MTIVTILMRMLARTSAVDQSSSRSYDNASGTFEIRKCSQRSSSPGIPEAKSPRAKLNKNHTIYRAHSSCLLQCWPIAPPPYSRRRRREIDAARKALHGWATKLPPLPATLLQLALLGDRSPASFCTPRDPGRGLLAAEIGSSPVELARISSSQLTWSARPNAED